MKEIARSGEDDRVAVRAERTVGGGGRQASGDPGGAVRKRCSGAGASSRRSRVPQLRRGHQPGAAGHGRTRRPALEERTEEHDPPPHACVCSSCGKSLRCQRRPHLDDHRDRCPGAHSAGSSVPGGAAVATARPRPLEVTAPPPERLFARTPYGTSVWARVLFERYACLRPLSRVSAWLTDQGLPISAGTLADSVPRFVPFFEPTWPQKSLRTRTKRPCAMATRPHGASSRCAGRAGRAARGCGPRSAKTRSTSTSTPRAALRWPSKLFGDAARRLVRGLRSIWGLPEDGARSRRLCDPRSGAGPINGATSSNARPAMRA